MKQLTILLILALIPLTSMAGSRGVNLAFVDATNSNATPEGKRLAELLVMDMKKLYTSELVGGIFPWNENTADIKVLNAKSSGLEFDRLLNTSQSAKIPAAMEKSQVQDGLIVFYYDRAHSMARLKLYDGYGKELLLIRLPLEGGKSPMKFSLMKGHRLGALAAIGGNVRWNP